MTPFLHGRLDMELTPIRMRLPEPDLLPFRVDVIND